MTNLRINHQHTQKIDDLICFNGLPFSGLMYVFKMGSLFDLNYLVDGRIVEDKMIKGILGKLEESIYFSEDDGLVYDIDDNVFSGYTFTFKNGHLLREKHILNGVATKKIEYFKSGNIRSIVEYFPEKYAVKEFFENGSLESYSQSNGQGYLFRESFNLKNERIDGHASTIEQLKKFAIESSETMKSLCVRKNAYNSILLQQFNALEYLKLFETPATFKDICSFKIHKLQTLDIHGTKVSQDELLKIRKMLPQTNVLKF